MAVPKYKLQDVSEDKLEVSMHGIFKAMKLKFKTFQLAPFGKKVSVQDMYTLADLALQSYSGLAQRE